MSSGSGYALGSSTSPGWTPQQIVYCQLASSSMEYVLLSGSGLVTSSIDISSFIASVVAGDPTVNAPLPSGQTPPDVILTVPCYVVVQLCGSSNWIFEPGSAPILTQSNLGTKYCGLNLVDASGNVYASQAPTTPPCQIMYFSVVTVAPASSNVSDPFSYYFQITQSGGNTYDLVLDPAFKNKGPG
jgi:hypothetical protein